jgi:NAD(P)-dependent dehydrogenase (short-subunit alcohol dehydrogenase family)
MRKGTVLKFAALAAGGYLIAQRVLPPGYSFAGKVAIVTGGSRGLGLELARQLALSGAHVAICARDEAELEVAREMLEARGADVFAAACDVTVRDEVERFVGDVLARFGRVDVLINNAGIIQATPMECATEDDYDRSLATHFYGPMYFVEAVLPHMQGRRQGRIANIASIGGKLSPPHLLPYTASKFALVGYSEGLGVELAKDGIRVTTICPGLMRTGSMVNAEFKGQHRKEYGWFAAGASIPVVTIDSTEAARRILDAIARGRREFIFPNFWKIAVTGHDVFRDTSLAVMAQMNKLFPAPGGIGPAQRKGFESESAFTRSKLTHANREAAVRNNE